VLSLSTFNDAADAMEVANDTIYGIGAGVWTRNIDKVYRFGRGIEAGRGWRSTYHQYTAHAAFGATTKSGIGREKHLMMLSHYQQTKNLLISYSEGAQGFF